MTLPGSSAVSITDWNVHSTSSAVNGTPSAHLMPGRSL